MHRGGDGRWVLPLDDAYIHQQYARQAALGRAFYYNDGDPATSGATSLLYPFVLAAAWRLGAQGDGLIAFSYALGVASLLATSLLAARLAGRMAGERLSAWQRRWGEWLAGLLVVTNGALVWGALSGMETGLYIVLVLAALNAWADRSPGALALWGGLLVLTRPEGLPVMVLLTLLYMVDGRVRGGAPMARRTWLLVIPLLLGLAQPLMNLALTGSLSASGMRAKSWLYNDPTHPLAALGPMAQTLARLSHTLLLGFRWRDGNPLRALAGPDATALYLPPLLGLLALGYALWRAVKEARDRRVGPGMALLLLIMAGLAVNATMMTAEWHLYRYILPYFTLTLVAGAVAVGDLAGWLSSRHAAAPVALGGLMVLLSVASVPGFVWRYEEASRATLRQPIRLAEWVREHLPPDARVGVHDVGAIRYYGERPTYDVVGLTNVSGVADAWRQGSGALYEAMERAERPPDYFAIYDDIWTLPYLAKTSLFARELFRVEYVDRVGVTVASDHQVVYEADWRLRNSGDTIYQPNVLDIVHRLTLMDTLDVADLHCEREHDYRHRHAPGRRGTTELHQLTYPMPPHPEVLDGGRMVSAGETFRLRTEPGQDMVLVGRFMSPDDIWLDVRVDGQPAGTLYYPGFAGAWQERALHIPGALITSLRSEIDVRMKHNVSGEVWHRAYYYWAFQGEMPRPEANMQHVVNAATDDGLRLLGYDLAVTRTEVGWEAQVTLYWTAERPLQRDLAIFLHWVDGDDAILTQRDVRPQDGAQPTWMWQPGFVIVDSHRLEIPRQDIHGLTTLYMGTYEADTLAGSPLEGADPAGRYELTRVELP